MGAEDELFLSRIKLDLCTSPEVLHKMEKFAVVAEAVWFDRCGYVYTSFCCKAPVCLEK